MDEDTFSKEDREIVFAVAGSLLAHALGLKTLCDHMHHDAVSKLLKREGFRQESATSADSASGQGGVRCWPRVRG